MCVIASIPAGQTVSEQDIRDMWQRNPDGGGISYIDKGQVKVYKSMKLKPYLKKVQNVIKTFGDNDILLHMRIATHGEVCIANTHPFAVKQNGKACKDIVFAHNGVLPSAYQTGKKDIDADGIQISDTRQFNELFWNNFDIYAIDDARVRELIEDILGWGNKFVVFNASKHLRRTTYIFNESRGSWKDGVWLSNTHHCSISYTKSDSWFTPTKEDEKILESIRQDNPDADFVPISRDDTGTTPEPSHTMGWGDDTGLYDPRLLNDSEWVAKLNNMLEKTGYQLLESAMDGMWFEFDYNGDMVCPSCGNKLDEENNWARTCHEDCDMFEFDQIPSSEYAQAEAEALADMAEERVAIQQIEDKMLHNIDKDEQPTLFNL